MKNDDILEVFSKVEIVIRQALADVSDWGLIPKDPAHPGQHYPDLVADQVACQVLHSAGFSIMSEESGFSISSDKKAKEQMQEEILVVMDPLDGSSNAAKGIPFYAVSLCAIDGQGPRVGYVSNLTNPKPVPFTAIRGEGAKYGKEPISPSLIKSREEALISVSAFPKDGLPSYLRSVRQFRAYGSAALEICMVASGALDAFLDCSNGTHAPWDYLAGMLICKEAGAYFVELQGKELLDLNMDTRRQTLSVCSLELLRDIQNARKSN